MESAPTRFRFEILEDPDEHVVASGSGYQNVSTVFTREYCQGETIQNISLDLNTPDSEGNDIIWFDRNFNPIYTTNTATVTPANLGLSSTPAPNTQVSATADIEYTTVPQDPFNFQVGELVIAYEEGWLFGDVIFPFQVNENIIGDFGATATVTQANFGDIVINNMNGIFYQWRGYPRRSRRADDRL